MRRTHLLVFATIVVVLGACSKSPATNPFKAIELTKAQHEMAQASWDFSFDLIRALSEQDKDNNISVSPFSLQTALSMASVGADGETRSEINRAIGLEDFSSADVCAFYETILPGLLGADNSTSISIANSVWAKPDAGMKSDYSKLLQDSFKASVHTLGSNAPSDISAWVNEATRGMIPDMRADVKDAEMVLVNALYFKGIWSSQFKTEDNTEDTFTNYDGTQTRTTFMNKKTYMRLRYGEVASSVTLPYGNNAYNMTIVIPTDENSDIDDVLALLDEDMWNHIVTSTKHTKVKLQLPKFESSYSRTLVPTLKALGIEKAFTGSAEFPFMSDKYLKIFDVLQQTAIKVDEKGSEAATSTQAYAGKTSAGPGPEAFNFIVDGPFFYAISESSTGVIVFAGVQRKM